MALSWAMLAMAAVLVSGWWQQSATPSAAVPAPPAAAAANGTKPVVDGAALFQTKGCTYCHGTDAGGIVGKGPSLKQVGSLKSNAEIYRQIHDGGMEMPPFGDALTEEELQGLVENLSHMKAPAHSPAVKRKKR